MPFSSSGGGSSHLSSTVVELIARACVLIGDPLGAGEIEQVTVHLVVSEYS